MNVLINSIVRASLIALLLGSISGCGGGSGGEGNGGSSGGGGSGIPPAPVTVSMGVDRLLDEGSDGGTTRVDFDVTLSAAASSDVTVDYAVAHVTTEDHDLSPVSGTLTFAAGETTKVLSIDTAADTAFELNEDFTVSLTNPSANATIGDGEAVCRLLNDDPLTVIMDLWNLGYFDVTLNGRALEFDYDLLIDVEDLLNDLELNELLIPYDIYYQSDVHLPFLVASGTLRIVGGSSPSGRLLVILPSGFDSFAIGGGFLVSFDWSALFDGLPEATWEFLAEVEPQDVDSTFPLLNVVNVNVFNEGDAGTSTDVSFIATLSTPLTTDIELSYTTLDGTATAPQDYLPSSGSVTLPAGETEAQFTVTVNGDDEAEGVTPEQFLVPLDVNSDDVVLSFPWVTGLIYDDDTPVEVRRIFIHNTSLVEGDDASADMVFDVTLDAPAITPVTFSFETTDDTAIAGSDYVQTFGEQTFETGESELTIPVPILGDTEAEDDETFFLSVTATFDNAVAGNNGVGTILTDEPLVRISVGDASVAEGNSDSSMMAFPLTLGAAADTALDISYITSDVTATAGVDYTAANSSITIPAGAVDGFIEVPVVGDPVVEDDEVFEITISTTAPEAILVDDTAAGTILNDDGTGGWQGQELVYDAGANGFPGTAVRPQPVFGPGGERQVLFLQNNAVWHTVSPGRTVWSSPLSVAPVDSMSVSPRLVADASGNAVATYTDSFLASRSYVAGTDWQDEPLPMAVETDNQMQLRGEPVSGEAFAIFQEAGSSANGFIRNIWAARFVPGNGWLDMGLVEMSDGNPSVPDLAVAANGAAIAVFPQPPVPTAETDVVAYHWNSGTWVGPFTLDSVNGEFASSSKIDINSNGNAAVTWFQREPVTSGIARESIYVNRYDAGVWTGAVLVERAMDHSARDSDVAIDAEGNVFVIWLQQSPDYSTENLHVSRYDVNDVEWSEPRLLEIDDTAPGRPIISQQVVADDLGNAIVIWTQSDGTVKNLRSARYSADDNAWDPAELLEEIDTGDAGIPELVIDRATGDAMVVWHHSDGSSVNIWANRYAN